jgi:hypothetical protein
MRLPDSPYACDVCEKRRDSDVNHWWVLTPFENAGATNCILRPYSDEAALVEGAAHACGQAHAQILVARFMNHGTFEKAEPELTFIDTGKSAPEPTMVQREP